MKTYGWLSPEKLAFINGRPDVLSLLYDLGLLPEEIGARVRAYVEEERERCAKIAETEPEPEGPMPEEARTAEPELIARAAVRSTRESIADRIRRSTGR
jgi:hypothetical protein